MPVSIENFNKASFLSALHSVSGVALDHDPFKWLALSSTRLPSYCSESIARFSLFRIPYLCLLSPMRCRVLRDWIRSAGLWRGEKGKGGWGVGEGCSIGNGGKTRESI